jgi:hypothetical protein
VEALPLDDRETIAAMAREDEDPRVRRAAVGKLMDPQALASIARDDADQSVRDHASAMLRDVALESFEDVGEAESLEAVEAITDARVLAQIAKTATREIVALRALSRIEDAHALGSVAGHAAVDGVRRGAFESLRARGDRTEILAVAMNSDFKDTACAALESLTDRVDLEQVAARGRNKSAVKGARAAIREADEALAAQAARAAADTAEARAAAAAAAASSPADSAAAGVTPPHDDPLAPEIEPAHQTDGAETAKRRQEHEQLVERARAQEKAQRDADARRVDTEKRHVRLKELIEDAIEIAADADVVSARKRFDLTRRHWQEMSAGIEVEPSLLARFTELDAQAAARDAEAREADARARREALARVQHLLGRVEPLAEKADLSLKGVERALRDVRSALAAMPQLPSKQDFDEVTRRLKAVQTALTPKAQELREAEEWRQFANVAVQEQLCARMEALRAAEDPEAIAREVHELQQQWRAAADVPRGQADALWRRFKTAHDEVWSRCEAHFAAQARERAENLAKKVVLCERAEALADSTNWIQTAEEIKTLQADWKTIGPVSRGKEKAIWDRFRAACDRFFRRRHEDLAQRKATWAEKLAKKEALCVRAEALAESTDWEPAAADIKGLQAEWKTIGPVRKTRSEAIWQRFRAACDRFFARYAQRHDTARAERVAAREEICAQIEALAAPPEGSEPPVDLLAAVRTLRGRWQQEIAARGVDPDRARALDDRFAAAFVLVTARWPVAFTGTDLDPDANRKRMETLVRRMEDLATSIAGPVVAAAGDASLSPTTRLAAMLKEALAANTIGGKVDDSTRFRAAADDVRQAQAAWSRIGVVPDSARRQLADRFQRAVRRISEKTAAVGKASGPGGLSPRGR